MTATDSRSRTVRPAAAANDRVAVGVIGLGPAGRAHLADLLGSAAVEVVAVADAVKDRRAAGFRSVARAYAARKKSGTYAGCAAYRDPRDLLDHPGLDAVVIATPDHGHAAPAVFAARNGIHIFCETPLALTIAEGRRVADEAKAARVVFQTASRARTAVGGRFRDAVELVWNGRIGKLKAVRVSAGAAARPCDLPTEPVPPGVDWDLWLGPAADRGYHPDLCPPGLHKHPPAWRLFREFGGGPLTDRGAELFDVAQWAMKTENTGPVEVLPPADARIISGLRMVYASGVALIHGEFEGEYKADIVFEGTDGVLLAARGRLAASRPEAILDPLPATARRVYAAETPLCDWLGAVRQGRECGAPAETGHRTATVCHLANIGYSLRRRLTWDPAQELFPNDVAANRERAREPRAGWRG